MNAKCFTGCRSYPINPEFLGNSFQKIPSRQTFKNLEHEKHQTLHLIHQLKDPWILGIKQEPKSALLNTQETTEFTYTKSLRLQFPHKMENYHQYCKLLAYPIPKFAYHFHRNSHKQGC